MIGKGGGGGGGGVIQRIGAINESSLGFKNIGGDCLCIAIYPTDHSPETNKRHAIKKNTVRGRAGGCSFWGK